MTNEELRELMERPTAEEQGQYTSEGISEEDGKKLLNWWKSEDGNFGFTVEGISGCPSCQNKKLEVSGGASGANSIYCSKCGWGKKL